MNPENEKNEAADPSESLPDTAQEMEPRSAEKGGGDDAQEEASAEEPEILKDPLEVLQEENAKLSDRFLRLSAEFENFRKRSERERLNAIKFANEKLLREMIPVLDNLEHALSAVKQEESGDPQTMVKHLVEGVTLVEKQFVGVLGALGIKQIEAKGKPFDPMLHEAMSEICNDDLEHHTIMEVYQKGYTLNDRLVRPARVVLSKKSE